MEAKKLYFEDVAEGDDIPELVKKPVTRVQLVKYAGASGDFNPLHTVEEFARSAGFPQPIAHGMLSMGFVGQLLTDWLPPGSLRKFGVRFTAVTSPGDIVTCGGRITKKFVSDKDKETLIECELYARNQKGETTVKGYAVASLPTRE